MTDFQIIGRFVPSCYDGQIILQEFRDFLAVNSVRPSEHDITVRDPYWHRQNTWDDEIRSWHNDCFGADMRLIVWTNIYPTEIKDLPDAIEPFEVAIWQNKKFKHRQPIMPASVYGKRWFVRGNVYR